MLFMQSVIPAFFLISALSLPVEAAKLTGAVRVDGSSTVYPITEAVAEEFQKQNSKVRVTVGTSGTGGGFKKFVAGEIDISNASRPIKAEEADKAKQAGIEFLELQVAYDGLSIVVNKSNKMTKISKEQLKKIWEPGSKVVNWKDIDKTLPNSKIKLYGPGPDSGTFDYFTEEVVGTAKASRSDYTASEDDNVLVRGVSSDLHALGYFGFAYFLENQSKLKALAIDAGKGAVVPTNKTIEDGTYPLSRPLFIYVSKKSVGRPEVRGFVEYYLKHVKTLAQQVGYVPLPSQQYSAESSKWTNWVKPTGKAKG